MIIFVIENQNLKYQSKLDKVNRTICANHINSSVTERILPYKPKCSNIIKVFRNTEKKLYDYFL